MLKHLLDPFIFALLCPLIRLTFYNSDKTTKNLTSTNTTESSSQIDTTNEHLENDHTGIEIKVVKEEAPKTPLANLMDHEERRKKAQL